MSRDVSGNAVYAGAGGRRARDFSDGFRDRLGRASADDDMVTAQNDFAGESKTDAARAARDDDDETFAHADPRGARGSYEGWPDTGRFVTAYPLGCPMGGQVPVGGRTSTSAQYSLQAARSRWCSTGVIVAAQIVVITGSTQGLGFGYAREFLRRGHHVIISGRSSAGVEAAIAELQKESASGARVIGRACEVSELASVQALWDAAVNEFGRVDIWLNNAGFARTGPAFADNTPAEIEAMVRANVIGSIHSAQVAVAGFSRQGGGRLYLTLGGGGASGRVVKGMTVYSTTKRAVKYLADSLVKERAALRDESILIGTISPGINLTEGMIREMRTVPPSERAKALKQLNFIGDHVETTTPWIVERILRERKQRHDITWLTSGRLLRRALAMLVGSRRDVVSRYSFNEGSS